MRAIILRFDSNDELILAIDKVRRKLSIPMSSITKTALWEYCNRILNEDGTKSKTRK